MPEHKEHEYSSFFDSTLWWMGGAVIASTEITSDGETMPYICVHKTNISPNKKLS